MIRATFFFTLFVLLLTIGSGFAWAVESPDDVLIANAFTKLTRADYDAALTRIPEDLRDEFATSTRRLTMFLNNILVNKTLAAQAVRAGLQPEPGMPTDTPEELERALVAAQVRAIEEAAARNFDARRDALVPTARESYLLAKEKYQRPEEVRISLIVISRETRSGDAALALARATRDKLLAWADFAAVAKEVSDDKATAAEGGSVPWRTAAQLDPVIANVAFAMQRVGEISEPVLVRNYYLLIRLDEKRAARQIPFDEAKDSILAALRSEYINNQRESHLNAIRTDPAMQVDQPAIDALVRRIDPERFKPSLTLPAPEPTPPLK